MLKIIGGGRVGFEPKIRVAPSGWYIVQFNISNKRMNKNQDDPIYDDMNVTFMTKDEEKANSIVKGCIVDIGTNEHPAQWQSNKGNDGKKYYNALTFDVTITKYPEGYSKPQEDPLEGINLDDLPL
jgi:single-stranded DNA-binding protein